MKLIPLTQGQFAMVDDNDYNNLIAFKWFAMKSKHTYYAARQSNVNGKQKIIQMHRYLLGVTDRSIVVNHKDYNGLNNQKYNIRPCAINENGRHLTSHINSSSKYLGVAKHTNKQTKKEYNYWVSHIKIKGKDKHIGCFPFTEEGEILAAKRYDSIAKEHYKDFANLNFK